MISSNTFPPNLKKMEKRDPYQDAGSDYPNMENGVGGNESEYSQSKSRTSITTVPSIRLKYMEVTQIINIFNERLCSAKSPLQTSRRNFRRRRSQLQLGWSIWFKHICHPKNNKPINLTHVDNAKNIIKDKPEDGKEKKA